MEWISVNGKLPEFEQDVLLYRKADGGFEWFVVGHMNSYTTSKTKTHPEWVVDGKYGEFEATHWMPLPKPPKQ